MKRLVLFALLLTACRQPRTAAEHCREQAGWARMGRNMNGRQSPSADALENMRCDAIERDEHANAREREKATAENQAKVAAMNAALDERLAVVRANPETPELGATLAEAKVLCERQRGQFSVHDDFGSHDDPAGTTSFGCRVGGPTVFAGLALEARVTRIDTYFEGANFTQAKARLERDLGPSEREMVSSEGFRVFLWRSDSVALTMYAKGVRLTILK